MDSPIERIFEQAIAKHLAPSVTLERESEVTTFVGGFRIDFVLADSLRRIGVECDGREFHDEYRDEWRDAMILGHGAVDEMIRFRGQDLVYRAEDCLYLLTTLHPALFSERGLWAAKRLASEAIQACAIDDRADRIRIGLPIEMGTTELLVTRRTRRETPGRREYWRELYAAAQKSGGGSLDEIIEADRARWTKR